MSEAIRLLAQEKSLSEDALLHVLVDALASAYKRRPGAAESGRELPPCEGRSHSSQIELVT